MKIIYTTEKTNCRQQKRVVRAKMLEDRNHWLSAYLAVVVAGNLWRLNGLQVTKLAARIGGKQRYIRKSRRRFDPYFPGQPYYPAKASKLMCVSAG